MSRRRDDLIAEVNDAFSDLKRAMHAYAPDQFAPLGLSLTQLGLLHKICDSQPITQAALAKKMQLTPGAINQVIDTLEQADCIIRANDKSDRRIVNLSVSRHGMRLLKEFTKIGKQMIADAFTGIPDEDIAVFVRVQKTVTQWLELEHSRKEYK